MYIKLLTPSQANVQVFLKLEYLFEESFVEFLYKESNNKNLVTQIAIQL